MIRKSNECTRTLITEIIVHLFLAVFDFDGPLKSLRLGLQVDALVLKDIRDTNFDFTLEYNAIGAHYFDAGLVREKWYDFDHVIIL